jgi:hypothetical protein
MARLQLKTPGFEQRAIELKLGTNRLGRAADSDLRLEHLTVSAAHCELSLGCGQIYVRDCGSTNGTYVDGTAIQDAVLLTGQTLRVGEVELLVTDTQAPISIPTVELPIAASPVVQSDGSTCCGRHQSHAATYQCQHCQELLCEDCIHRLRRRGGKFLLLCPLCSYPVRTIAGEQKKKKSLLHRLRDTTRLFLSRAIGRN